MSALRVNESKIIAENAFNPDHLWMEGKHESKSEGKSFSYGFLPIHERFLNP